MRLVCNVSVQSSYQFLVPRLKETYFRYISIPVGYDGYGWNISIPSISLPDTDYLEFWEDYPGTGKWENTTWTYLLERYDLFIGTSNKIGSNTRVVHNTHWDITVHEPVGRDYHFDYHQITILVNLTIPFEIIRILELSVETENTI